MTAQRLLLLLVVVVVVTGCATQRGEGGQIQMEQAADALVGELEAMPNAGTIAADVSRNITNYGTVVFTSILPAGATQEQAEDVATRAERAIWTSQVPSFGSISINVLAADRRPLVQRLFALTREKTAWFEPRYGSRPPGTMPGLVP